RPRLANVRGESAAHRAPAAAAPTRAGMRRSTVMRSSATDGMSAPKCQGKWPDQTLDQAFGLPEALVAVSPLASVLQEGRENANIDAGLGFIWRISDNEGYLFY